MQHQHVKAAAVAPSRSSLQQQQPIFCTDILFFLFLGILGIHKQR
jgi:hypothetical protein